MPNRLRRGRRAKGGVTIALGAVVGILLFGIGASIFWSTLIGLGTFGLSFGASFLVGGAAEGTDLDEVADDAGLSSEDGFGDG